MSEAHLLYEVDKNLRCIPCGHVGAIRTYGQYYPHGMGDKVDTFGELSRVFMEKYRNAPRMNHAMGFGGTIPWECTNCGNIGLHDFNGLEGYRRTFERVE